MIRGVGVDLLAAARMERPLSSGRFRARVFTPGEWARITRDGAPSLQMAAGVFCAKEACAKALGLGLSGLGLQGAEVFWEGSGRPGLRVSHPDAEGLSFHLSITHDGGWVMAFVVCERV